MEITIESPPRGEDSLTRLLTGRDADSPFSEVIMTAIERQDPTALGLAVSDAAGLVAYGCAVPNPDGVAATLEVAAPDHRGRAYEELVGKMIDALAERGIGAVVLWIHDDRTPHIDGLELERALHRMTAQLPLDAEARWPRGIEVRGFRPGEDEASWLSVNNAAFAGHPEQSGWSESDLTARYDRPWFDPEGLRMVWRADELLAFNWTKLTRRGQDLVGEIFVIAVHPGHHGSGLGTATAIEGLRDLSERQGASYAQLYVDASNAAGMALYRGLGFETEHISRAYRAARFSE